MLLFAFPASLPPSPQTMKQKNTSPHGKTAAPTKQA